MVVFRSYLQDQQDEGATAEYHGSRKCFGVEKFVGGRLTAMQPELYRVHLSVNSVFSKDHRSFIAKVAMNAKMAIILRSGQTFTFDLLTDCR